MAIKHPQHDLPVNFWGRLSGASADLCSEILDSELFEQEVASGSITGTLAATESGADTCSASGAVLVAGALAASEAGADSFAASGTVAWLPVSGTISATESGSDLCAASGSVRISGTLTATETGVDGCQATGSIPISGTVAATELSSDSVLVSGSVAISGTLAGVESGQDSVAIAGIVQVPPATGDLAATEEGADTAAIQGSLRITGTLSAIESGSDTAILVGLVRGKDAWETLTSGSTIASGDAWEHLQAQGGGGTTDVFYTPYPGEYHIEYLSTDQHITLINNSNGPVTVYVNTFMNYTNIGPNITIITVSTLQPTIIQAKTTKARVVNIYDTLTLVAE